MIKYWMFIVLVFLINFSFAQITAVKDEPFEQEYHEPFPFDGKINKIIIDRDQHVWIATANGIFRKNRDERTWNSILNRDDGGASFSLAVDDKGRVWMGTWNAVWRSDGNSLTKINGTEGPV